MESTIFYHYFRRMSMEKFGESKINYWIFKDFLPFYVKLIHID